MRKLTYFIVGILTFVILSGCAVINEFKEDNRKAYHKAQQPRKKVDSVDECSFSGQLNEYEKSQLRGYYQKIEVERKHNQEKVFGGLIPK